MYKLKISYLSKLRNQKFPEAFDNICTFLERGEITEDYLAACLNNVKAKKGELILLRNKRMKHPLTRTMSELNSARQDYLLSLRSTITNSFRSPYADERNAAKVLDIWLDGHREYLSKPRIHDQNRLVYQLTEEVDKDSALESAMELLNLTRIFGSIKMATSDIKAAFVKRSADQEAHNKKAAELRDGAYEWMKLLINALELAIKLESENSATYVGYWNEIAKMLDNFNASEQSRSTRRRNTAEKNEQSVDDEVDGEMDVEVMSNTPATRTTPKTTTTMRNTPYSAAGLNNGMDMDLQNVEETNEDLAATGDAMNGSGTINNNDVAAPTDGNTAQADDAMTDNVAASEATATGNGELTDGNPKTATADGGTTGHSDANDYNSKDE